mmetsp:Transcript_20142/g.47629  ORF Transcript_20142/g.47629 Transcript_20142/m.47629 type:complete len:786 (+) Transcript_20142:72-2429(+)
MYRPLLEGPASSPAGWEAPQDLEAFLQGLYRYFEVKGFLGIVAPNVSHMVALTFTILFFFVLLFLIDWEAVLACDSEESCRVVSLWYTQPWYNISPSRWGVLTCTLIFTLYWFFNVFQMWSVYKQARLTRRFYQEQLGILSDESLETMLWSEVVSRLVQRQKESRFCRVQDELNALEITNVIMRQDNFIIALTNHHAFTSTLPPWIPRRLVYTKAPLYNLRLGLFRFGESDRGRLEADFLERPEVLAGRLRFLGVLNVLLVPPVLIFVAIYFFMRHAQEFRSQRASPFRRQWSDYAQWTFREYNELPHQIEARMSAGHAAAEAYVHTTRPSSPVLKSALRCVKFIAGSVLAALLLVALWDDTPLLFVKIQEKNLLWYLAFFGFVFAVVDSAGEENAGDAEGKGSGSEACLHAPSVPLRMYIALMKLVSCTHHLPAHWRSPERLTSLAGACSGLRRASLCQHFRLVRQELLRDFLVHRIQVLAEELLGVLLSPILLFCFLSHAAPGIVRVLRRVRYATPCLGDFCLYGCLDPDRSGDFGVGAASSADSRRTLRRQFENDKLEKSILSFLLNHQLLWSPDDGADGFMFIRGQELQNELSERSWRQPTVPAIQLQELKHADDAAPLEWHADGPPGSMHPIEVVEQEAEGWHAEGPEGPHDRAREQQEFVLAHVLGVPPAAVAVLHEVQEFHEVETKENPSGEDYALLPSELLYLPSIVPGASASKAIATAAKTVVDEGQAKDKGDIFGALFFWLEALRKYQGNPVQMCESDDEGGGVFFRQPHTELTV